MEREIIDAGVRTVLPLANDVDVLFAFDHRGLKAAEVPSVLEKSGVCGEDLEDCFGDEADDVEKVVKTREKQRQKSRYIDRQIHTDITID